MRLKGVTVMDQRVRFISEYLNAYFSFEEMIMKYRIDEKQNGIDILLNEIAGKKEQLLESFAACRDGRCACPTGEYRKLESLEIDQTPDTITLHLKSKQGEKLETAEIIRCLESTERALGKDEKAGKP